MARIARSTFLKRVTGAAAGGAALLYPGLDKAFAAPSRAATPSTLPPGRTVLSLDGPDPTYAGGEVVSRSSTSLTLQSSFATSEVYVAPDAVVWKEFDLSPDAIDLGDWVDAKVEVEPDGKRVAKSGWIFVNIGRHDGTFRGLEPGGLRSETFDGKSHLLELSSRLEVMHAGGPPVSGGINGLAEGQPFGAVGLRLEGGGLRATRIWI